MLHLVSKVGSILEDQDQLGLAHFMEHMNFNGTKNYPKNQLIDYLQKAGISFGADLNAYTSFDETVYMLPIPLNDANLLSDGLGILRDWAQDATLDTDDINGERGVILEEGRLKKGGADRMSRAYFPMLLNNSRYAERLPIGNDSILKHFQPKNLKRFKNDWYRPDLQAVIVVGDVDLDTAEFLIKKKFSDLTNPKNNRERINYEIELDGKNQYLAVSDIEQPNINIQVLFKRHKYPIESEEDYVNIIKEQLLNYMLDSRRYDKISKESDPAYLDMNLRIQPFLGNVKMLAFSEISKKNRLKEGFLQTWRLISRIKKFGFTQQDLELAKTSYMSRLEKQFNERNHTPSSNFVKEYQNLFLNGDAAPGIKWELEFSKRNLPGITLEAINSMMKSYLTPQNMDVLILSPESDKDNIPSESTILSWMNEVDEDNLNSFDDEYVSKPLIENLPISGEVEYKEEYTDLGMTKLTLTNGATVWLKPTSFKSDQILFRGFSKGGSSIYEDKDFYNASNTAGLFSQMGIGDFNPTEIQKKLIGKSVGVNVNITNTLELVYGSSSPQDIEAAFKLLYLKFTAPRKDTTLFNSIINKAKENISQRYSSPQNVFADTISYVMGNYNYRASAPTIEGINTIQLDRAFEIYKERFQDASDFTFAFVGNFNEEEILPLITRYIGGLPSTYSNEEIIERNQHIPAGQLIKKVYKGSEDKAIVQMVYSGDYNFNAQNNLYLKALQNILQLRLLVSLREVEGGVYTPSVNSVFNKEPKSRFAITVSFGCAPENVDHLIGLVQNEMSNLRHLGPTDDEVDKFKAAYNKEIKEAFESNGFWLNYMISQAQNGEDIYQVESIESNLNSVTKSSLIQAANKFLFTENEIIFQLLPEHHN